MSMTVIEHIEVGSGGAASIVFDLIPATYTDLLLVYAIRTNRASPNASDAIYVKLNGSTSNFSARLLQGFSTTVQSVTETRFAGYATAAGSDAGTFGNSQIYFPNYASSAAKSYSSDGNAEKNAADGFNVICASLWNDTSAIDEITLESATASTIQEYSSATLYGITAGSDGTTTVS